MSDLLLHDKIDAPFSISSQCYVISNKNHANCDVLLRMTHGGSKTRIIMSHGGLRRGKDAGHFLLANMMPLQFYTLHRTDMQIQSACPSIKQFTVTLLWSALQSGSSPANTILGGWSLGAIFALKSSLTIEDCDFSPRAAFAFDARQLSPINMRCRHCKKDEESLAHLSAEDFASFARTPFIHFSCPAPARTAQALGWLDDARVQERLAIFTHLVEPNNFPFTSHTIIAVECVWDIARRLRMHISAAHE